MIGTFAEPWFCKVLNDGRPDSSSATTSPSITVSSGSGARAFAIVGYLVLKSLLFRDRRCTFLSVLTTRHGSRPASAHMPVGALVMRAAASEAWSVNAALIFSRARW